MQFPDHEGVNRMDLTSPHTHLQCTQVANFSTRGLSQALPHVREGTHKALGESSGQKMLHELSMIIPMTCSVGVHHGKI